MLINLCYILLVVLLLLPLAPAAEAKVSDFLANIFGSALPRHKILPVIRIVLCAILLIFSYMNIVSDICLVAIIAQNVYFIKRS